MGLNTLDIQGTLATVPCPTIRSRRSPAEDGTAAGPPIRERDRALAFTTPISLQVEDQCANATIELYAARALSLRAISPRNAGSSMTVMAYPITIVKSGKRTIKRRSRAARAHTSMNKRASARRI